MRGVPILCVLLLCSACAKPSAWEEFIPAGQADGGVFQFKLDLSDSTAVYDLSFFTRRDVSERMSDGLGESLLLVNWIDPDGECVLKDSVFMNLGWARGVCCEYRLGVRPEKSGEWLLRVRIPDPGPSFRGFGLKYEQNGTR